MATTITAIALYDKYKYKFTISEIVGSITNPEKKDNKVISVIIARITTNVIRSMMTDVVRVRELSGNDKKKLIIETIDFPSPRPSRN